jgi:hypothetical protein
MELICLDEHIESANKRMKQPLRLTRLNEISISLEKVIKGLGESDVGQCRRLATYIETFENPTILLNFK